MQHYLFFSFFSAARGKRHFSFTLRNTIQFIRFGK